MGNNFFHSRVAPRSKLQREQVLLREQILPFKGGPLGQFFPQEEQIFIRKSTLKCLSIGTPKVIHFPFVSNEKLMFLGVPIFKHITMRL